MSDVIQIPALVDMHYHAREGDQLKATLTAAARWCDTILVMPNTVDPLTTTEKAMAYWSSLREHKSHLNVIQTLYLTESTSPMEIKAADFMGITAVKAYPKGKTSHSGHGIKDWTQTWPALRRMEELQMTLLIHPEHPGSRSWNGEHDFFTEIWPTINNNFPKLRIVAEHVSSALGIETMLKAIYENTDYRAATITAHHLYGTIDDLLDFGETAHHCKPCLKLGNDRQTLLRASAECPQVMFGSDAAPWKAEFKLQQRACAGCWTANYTPHLLATVFDEGGVLGKLQEFAHDRAVRWWKLQPSKRKIQLSRGFTKIEDQDRDGYIPFLAGRVLFWEAEICPENPN